MSDSPNKAIPYVPENTLDPAAGLNQALDVLDATDSVASAISMSLAAPPTPDSDGPNDGDLYVVAPSGATGAWSGLENRLVRYVAAGDYWKPYLPGTNIRVVYNAENGQLYKYDDLDHSPPAWVPAYDPGIVSTASANTDATRMNSGKYTRFSHASATYTFDAGDGLIKGAEYHGRYVGSGVLTITAAGGMTINAPAAGTLVIPPQGTFTVKIVGASEADLYGLVSSS